MLAECANPGSVNPLWGDTALAATEFRGEDMTVGERRSRKGAKRDSELDQQNKKSRKGANIAKEKTRRPGQKNLGQKNDGQREDLFQTALIYVSRGRSLRLGAFA